MTGAPAYLALDLGTSELKAGLVDGHGRLHALARSGYPLDVDATGRAEQDVDRWWSAVCQVVATVRADAPQIMPTAICAVGQGPTVVPTDPEGRATRPAITWLDTRAGRESADLEHATGQAGWALGILPQSLRIERTEREVAARTRWYLHSWEWLAYRLCGVVGTTVTGGQQIPHADAAAAAGLDPSKFAPAITTGERLGGVLPDVAGVLDLPAGIPVIAGAVDAYASFFGAGLAEAGDALDVGGTAGGFAVYWDREVRVPGAFAAPAPIDGLWLYGGAMAATGKALDWLRESVFGGDVDTATLLAEAAAVAPAADGLVFLPYLAGERSPLWDPTARGAFAGLSLGHGRGHLTRAVLEAAALALRHVAAPIRVAGVGIRELRVSGGAARSPLWNRIKADVLGVPVRVPEVPETALMGAAVLASVGAGDQPAMPTAMRALVRFAGPIAPDPMASRTYDVAYEAYTALHPAISPIVGRLRTGLADRPADEAWADAPKTAGPAPKEDHARAPAVAVRARRGAEEHD